MIKKCSKCEKPITVYPYRLRERNFCSKKCYFSSIKVKDRFCVKCGKKIYKYRKPTNRYKLNLCLVCVQEQLIKDGFYNRLNIGKKHSIATRKKMSDTHKREKAYNWKGENNSKKIRLRENLEYRLWRESVFERDSWTCRICKKRGGDIFAHHLFSFAEFPDLRYVLRNGLTVCKKCHKTFHKNLGLFAKV